jgi:spectinomycin phosphotransferase
MPEGLSRGDLVASLVSGWGLGVRDVGYVPEGAGSYHWRVVDDGGVRYFVTVDDLDAKPWLGTTREVAFGGVGRAFATAAALRDDAHLAFVAAPVPALDQTVVRRLDDRYSVAVFPYLDGRSGRFGVAISPGRVRTVVALLADLHQANGTVRANAPVHDVQLAYRHDLEIALSELRHPWDAGPLSERARRVLSDQADTVTRWLARFDQLAVHAVPSSATEVVTHGEPHPGNFMYPDPHTVVLVDWDTVGLAPPERDLWMICGATGDAAAEYSKRTGHPLVQELLDLYRVRWALDDISIFTRQLRAPHAANHDTHHAYQSLQRTLLGASPIHSAAD